VPYACLQRAHHELESTARSCWRARWFLWAGDDGWDSVCCASGVPF